ncbi:Uncharacterized protein ESCO_003023 [Escovopsis weberi]|uniref:DUF2415 domain-containing protein n=1 Tax=Escovopsis weberi TaxID=150374 RepID=A0A0M9VT09_ESCWE|nr:Uncharacterized protein ESCO_003023 [Escovopsis weberi]
MAVENDVAFLPTDHWQLRSLISAENQHIVYFPGGKGSDVVQRLNTLTHECETIRLLSFVPRCLVAENGWLCCGSERGDFVAIRLDDPSDRRDKQGRGQRAGASGAMAGEEADPRAEGDQGDQGNQGDQGDLGDRAPDSGSSRSTSGVDSDPHVPLVFGPSSSSEELLALLEQTQCTNSKPALAKSMKLAGQRINCVTLWFPPTDLPADENAYDEPVAVLANNDKTVTLVSLHDFDANDKTDPLDVVTYPDLVNRAVISPDGRIMIAILDDPYLYVHQRVKVSADKCLGMSSCSRYRWELKKSFLLKSQREDDFTDNRGSFAACFSSSGIHLAVGTQHGTISIFDAALLTQSAIDPLITTFTSSRPHSPAGAVRDMAFCPGPYDLLAWSEDRGHVGVADMRSDFTARLIVDINVEAGLEHITVLDRNAIDPRLTQEAIQYDRRRRDRGSSQNTEISPPLYRPRDAPPLQDSAEDHARRLPDGLRFPYRAPITDGDPSRPQEGRRGGGSERSGILAFSELRNRLRDRDRNAARDWREGPRVQAGTSRRFDLRLMRRDNDTVAALRELRDQRSRPDPNYENVLEILFARDVPSGTENEIDETSLLVPLVNQVVNRWEESAIRGTLTPDQPVFDCPPSPDNTAGVAWSQDGGTLFIGAQNGIYELKVNTYSRKFCPSIKMR